MRKKRNTTSGLRGVLPAALVLLGWISFVGGQAISGLPIGVKLILLVVARVLPQAFSDLLSWQRHITAATPPLTHLICLGSISVQESVVFVPLFLPRLGVRPSARENESFIAATGASFDSGKNNGGVAANVMRKQRYIS